MNPSTSFWTLASVACAAALTGCGKSEPAANQPAASAPAAATPSLVPPDVAITPAPLNKTEATPVPIAKTPAAPVTTKVTIPDFQTVSVEKLSSVASQVLTNLGATAGATSPELAEKVNAVQAALVANQAVTALSSLTGLNEAVKGIPGGEALAGTATQLVSAWALKQGFDAAKISGVLGALQKKDYAALASQATGLLAKGGLTGEQKGILNGVLGAYGIDATKAAGAVDAVKGLFNK